MPVNIPVGSPAVVHHDRLGKLSVDLKQVEKRYAGESAPINVFAGDIEAVLDADGTLVRITLTPELVADLPEWVERCATRIFDAITRLDEIKLHAANDHLGIKNEHWLADGELPLGREAFIDRLKLDALNLLDDEGMDVFFEDGGLFAGHAIIVSLTEDGRPDYVELFG